jgi:hypothetical protein
MFLDIMVGRPLRLEGRHVRHIEQGDLHIAHAIAPELNLQHAPYPPRASPFQPAAWPWLPFLDDLITLSWHEKSLVIFVNSVDVFPAENTRGLVSSDRGTSDAGASLDGKEEAMPPVLADGAGRLAWGPVCSLRSVPRNLEWRKRHNQPSQRRSTLA